MYSTFNRGRRVVVARRRAEHREAVDRLRPAPPRAAAPPRTCCPFPPRSRTCIVPCIASTRCFESASPSPVPSTPVASAPSRSNGVKSRSSLSAAIPAPGVGDVNAQAVPGRALTGDGHRSAGPVVLHGVRQQVQEHLLQALAIGQDVQVLVDDGDAHGDAPRSRRAARASIAWRRVSCTETGSSEICRCPASIRLMSSTSLISPSRWRPARRI